MGSSNTIILDSLHNHTIEELSKTGIYTIKSKINNKYYVGRATRISIGNKCIGFRERWRDHIRQLIKGTHYNIYLQRHVNKYGIQDLEFKILNYYESEYCASAELYWIRMLDSVESGFNMTYNDVTLKFGINSPVYKIVNEESIINDYLNTENNIKNIAVKNNVSEYKINNVLLKNNIKIINKRSTGYKYNYNEIHNYYLNNKLTIIDIAKKYKVDKNTILTHFRGNGLKLKREIFRDNINLIYKRYLSGEEVSKIANEYKVDPASIYNYFIECGLKNKFEIVRQDINKIYLRYLNGESVRLKIAVEYGISQDVIYRLFKKNNLKLKYYA